MNPMTQDGQLFELQLEAEADVVRGCCGQAHEFGPCPNKDSDTNQAKEK